MTDTSNRRISQAGVDMLERIGALSYLENSLAELAEAVLALEPSTVGEVYEACNKVIGDEQETNPVYAELKQAAEADGDPLFGPTLHIMATYLGDRMLETYLAVNA